MPEAESFQVPTFSVPEKEQTELARISPKDKPWDKHRYHADKVGQMYAGTEFQRYAERVSYCSQILDFAIGFDDKDALKLKLRNARFCRVRHCPVCQWRRSLRWKARAYKVLPRIVEKYPTHRWLFLTLTQKNVAITDLKETLKEMNSGFRRLTQLKNWPAVGWLRSTEVTRGRNGTAHPHFHCLLMVPSTFFNGRNYITQAKWAAIWQKAMKLDYEPILDVRAVKQGKYPMDLVPELLKYCTKESDMTADREWFLELTRQLYKVRTVATGGVLKQFLSELEQEPDDLIGNESEAEIEQLGSLQFGWKTKERKYKVVDFESTP
jgi:plasmid rolling circle replication initiator protein Rep